MHLARHTRVDRMVAGFGGETESIEAKMKEFPEEVSCTLNHTDYPRREWSESGDRDLDLSPVGGNERE